MTKSVRRLTVVALAVLLVAGLSGCLSPEGARALSLINGDRSSRGIPTLQENFALHDKAQAWADHMARTGTLSHSNVLAGVPSNCVWAVAENVAMTGGGPDALHATLMMSPPHRENILSRSYNSVGIGIAMDSRGVWWEAQVFASCR